MTDNSIKKFCAGLMLCMSLSSLTGCGSSSDGASENAVMGRLTAVSESQIKMEAFERQNKGEKPQGTPPAVKGDDNQKPGDDQVGEKPEGTPPAMDDKNPQGRKGETKTYQISSDTKIYKQQGEEKTEISINEVDLGTMISVETDGDEATSIIVQDMPQFGNRGDRVEQGQQRQQQQSSK